VWSYGTLALRREDEATSCGKVFGEREHFVEGVVALAARRNTNIVIVSGIHRYGVLTIISVLNLFSCLCLPARLLLAHDTLIRGLADGFSA
jgi:hypothetical protein